MQPKSMMSSVRSRLSAPVKAAARTLAVTLMSLPLHAVAQPVDQWTFSLTPYLWLPSLDAKLRYGPPPPGGASANVEIDTGDILERLNFVLMLQGEARKDRWLIGSDFIYFDFGNEDSKVRSVDFNPGPGPINVSTTQLNAGTQTSLDAVVWTVFGGYNVVNQAGSTLDLIGGLRYANVDTRTNWNLTAAVTGPAGTQTFAGSGTVERSVDLWDGIIGAKGRVRFGNGQWFMPYYVDIGTGNSDLTWQGSLGVGYAFNWGDVLLSYRYLYYKEDDGKLVEKLTFDGFAFGVNFRF